MFWTWRETVCGLITSSAAISRFVRPAATRRSTSSSRSVRRRGLRRCGASRARRDRAWRRAVRTWREPHPARPRRRRCHPVRAASERDADTGTCRVIGHPERAPPCAGAAQRDERPAGVAFGEQDGARGAIGDGVQQGCIDQIGEAGQLVAGGSSLLHVAGGEVHVDGSGEHRGPGSGISRPPACARWRRRPRRRRPPPVAAVRHPAPVPARAPLRRGRRGPPPRTHRAADAAPLAGSGRHRAPGGTGPRGGRGPAPPRRSPPASPRAPAAPASGGPGTAHGRERDRARSCTMPARLRSTRWLAAGRKRRRTPRSPRSRRSRQGSV